MNLENLLKKIKKGKKFIRNALIAGLISSGLFLTSCPSPPPPPPSPDKENELSENTQVLPEQDILKITALYDNEITLSEPISYLSSGDIIVGDISDVTPNGFLRKVEYISGNGRIIYTEPASLEEALKNADFEFQGTLYPMNAYSLEAKSGVSEKLLTPQSLLEFNINLDNVILYDFDGNESTTWDQIIANGNISFNSDFYLKFKIRDLGLKQLVFKNITNEDSWLEISTLNNLENIEKEVKIAEFYFHPFIAGYLPTVPPFPIIIQPILEVNVGMNGSISNIETSVTQSASLTAGLSYEREKGWSIIKEFKNSFSWIPPTLPEISYFKAYAGPQLNFLLYGIAGPYGEIDGYLKFDAEQSPWKLYGGLEALLGVKMQIFSWEIADYSAKVIDYEKLLAEGEIQPSGPKEKILFYSGTEFEDSEIYMINTDGSNMIKLTDNSSEDKYACWSPDGKKIAFASNRDGNWEIYIMNIDGSNITRLTNNSNYDSYPHWSPNGQEIVFISNRGDPYGQIGEIYMMNIDGVNQRKLEIQRGSGHEEPRWSPDGTQIVFSSTLNYGEGDWDIYVVNKDGTGLKRLTTNSNIDYAPSWSPDGTKIAFASLRDGNREIYIMNADGTTQVNLTNNLATDSSPSWSRDGSKIVFVSNRDRYNQIYMMNADGSSQRRLFTHDYHHDGYPMWSPVPIE